MTVQNQPFSPNFGFLASSLPSIYPFIVRAERYLFDDPNTSMLKSRQFAEGLTQRIAASAGVYYSREDSQFDLINRLENKGYLSRENAQLLHTIRQTGNDANHQFVEERRDAFKLLRLSHRISMWFYTAFIDPQKRFNKFIPPSPPKDPAAITQGLKAEIQRLTEEYAKAKLERDALESNLQQEQKSRGQLQQEMQDLQEEWEAAMELLDELSQEEEEVLQVQTHEALQEIQAVSIERSIEEEKVLVEQVAQAEENLDPDESLTRLLIDEQLEQAGWTVDSTEITHKNGYRPVKNKNMAISEWPVKGGFADYVLFVGLTPVAIVEAKRRRKNVGTALEQCKRYSRSYRFGEKEEPAGEWGEYKIPFLFSTNGKPYLKQLIDSTGVHYVDVRLRTNLARVLPGWYTPEGLTQELERNQEEANTKLQNEKIDYLPLRTYQQEAIEAVEQGIIDGKRSLLLAMATGTGKTRTAICMVYRLIKAKRFRRVLFLVDRSTLGIQAQDAFKDLKLEQQRSFPEIYGLKSFGEIEVDTDTKLHFSTVQGLIQRIMYSDSPTPVDQYDCIVIDECHRGYTLDKHLSDTELGFRSFDDYISKYRRVLEHFDAVKIGLTATPALHTSKIFGKPIYSYGYRQAVIDGHLADYDPPIEIITQKSEDGIHFEKGTEVLFLDKTLNIEDLSTIEEDLDYDLKGFNTKVQVEGFNRVVCEILAENIDPTDDEKTLIFCATDRHCDMVVRLLKEEFQKKGVEVYDDSIMKITGSVDKYQDKIKLYKNERYPNIAVTVDLLTTGVDVPKICNIVFLRHLKSRILFEQMLGRATRKCDEIGKEHFTIYDAVRVCRLMNGETQMTPVVKQPNITFAQLLDELKRVEDEEQSELIIEQFAGKLQRKMKKISEKVKHSIKDITGVDIEALVDTLKDEGKRHLILDKEQQVANLLDNKQKGPGYQMPIDQSSDVLSDVRVVYGDTARPEDYLEEFGRFLEEKKNEIPALLTVMQRPKELTRQALRELAIILDSEGYSEHTLQRAFHDVTNQEIAATIVGFIRQKALGSALISYEERVRRAEKLIQSKYSLNKQQRNWLSRIAKQVVQEIILDKDALDSNPAFRSKGGFRQVNKQFQGQLEQILTDLHEAIWEELG